jgi:hypothetical protein
MSNRDTQFAGFAKLLTEELRVNGAFPVHPLAWEELRPDIEKIIARRAYDFLVTCQSVTSFIKSWRECEEVASRVPDVTSWPKEVPDGRD